MLFNSMVNPPQPYAQPHCDVLRSDEGKEYVGMLAHELRNGLHDIRLLHLAAAQHPPGHFPAAIGLAPGNPIDIDAPLARMSLLIDDLLEYCRVAHRRFRLNLRGTDLRDVVHRAAHPGRRLQYENQEVKLEVSVPRHPVYAVVDSDRLAMAVENLLDNALRHTPPGGRVRAVLDESSGQAILRIHDDGAGMSPQTLAALFQPFAQGAESSHRALRGRGLGLGLLLVRTIVELHGGNVAVQSRGPSLGSEFTISLPQSN